MTDDIVKRLLDFTPLNDADLASLMLDAASEIERLREAMRLMYAHYHNDNGSELVAVYEKVVRGE